MCVACTAQAVFMESVGQMQDEVHGNTLSLGAMKVEEYDLHHKVSALTAEVVTLKAELVEVRASQGATNILLSKILANLNQGDGVGGGDGTLQPHTRDEEAGAALAEASAEAKANVKPVLPVQLRQADYAGGSNVGAKDFQSVAQLFHATLLNGGNIPFTGMDKSRAQVGYDLMKCLASEVCTQFLLYFGCLRLVQCSLGPGAVVLLTPS
jgi:uncharacterized small protein (DUF1192 family)